MERVNQIVFNFIHGFAGRSHFVDGFAIFLGDYLPYLMVFGFLLFAYYQRGTRKKIYVFCEGAIAIMVSRGLATEIIRLFYHHERPFSFYHFIPLISEAGWSFPSGHAAWFFALSMTIWYVNRKWGIWYFSLSILMSIARIYAGVHWPYDILAGIVVGVLSAMAVHALLASSRKALSS